MILPAENTMREYLVSADTFYVKFFTLLIPRKVQLISLQRFSIKEVTWFRQHQPTRFGAGS